MSTKRCGQDDGGHRGMGSSPPQALHPQQRIKQIARQTEARTLTQRVLQQSDNSVPSPPLSPPSTVRFQGRSFIPPSSRIQVARSAVPHQMSVSLPEEGSGRQQRESGLSVPSTQEHSSTRRPVSNLTMLLDRQQSEAARREPLAASIDRARAFRDGCGDEADTASGPAPTLLGSSLPSHAQRQTYQNRSLSFGSSRSSSAGVLVLPQDETAASNQVQPLSVLDGTGAQRSDRVRRCLSSRELGALRAPASTSPYSYMLYKKVQLESSFRQRLQSMRESIPSSSQTATSASTLHDQSDESSTSASSSQQQQPRPRHYRTQAERSNRMRNQRRAQHNEAVIEDLCAVVADLFVAESKLLKPWNYGFGGEIGSSSFEYEQVLKSIRSFISALPTRYALGADTPSEVLLHMRLMAAARADATKVVVHIHNLDHDTHWSRAVTSHGRKLRLVTVSCTDAVGLLEYITKLLAMNSSRVLDADVMLSTDGIVLDRFVVEMNGRLRLDTLANLIEAFLKQHSLRRHSCTESANSSVTMTPSEGFTSRDAGPLYYNAIEDSKGGTRDFQQEMETAVPLTQILGPGSSNSNVSLPALMPKLNSVPGAIVSLPSIHLTPRYDRSVDGVSIALTPGSQSDRFDEAQRIDRTEPAASGSGRRQLVNRRGYSNLDAFGEAPASNQEKPAVDFVTFSNFHGAQRYEEREVPLIPFDELMLIETLGTGRVSTIYRAAWRQPEGPFPPAAGVQMVALKVAMVNNVTGDTSHVDELRREADIGAQLSHPNICDLVGVAADHDCFCLAYDFCEGGSLLSLLSDTRRFYEYLPIALDIANGMAYLHSRNVIHRDLKPSNVLLTRDHRAKIADFGMSVANTGQELTAETGTYRYMAPEVIRHESYSSNADVYSFGICLWQLITREIPFATMTPIQAAYAVAEGRRPSIPTSVPRRLREIITACWDQDSHRRPSFTYIAMALADYAKMAFSPANVGALTVQIANEMLANVEGNSNVNVDFTTPVGVPAMGGYLDAANLPPTSDSIHSHNVGLEIE